MNDEQEILEFWFSPLIAKQWFSATPMLDAEIRTRFEGVWQRAAAGDLENWAETAAGALALIIVLDQLPLNMYRGEPSSFSTEQKAVGIARWAIARGLHNEMPADDHRLFMFLPLMHSENLGDQDLSVKLFRDAGMNTHWPEHHRNIILRFGRFPHRNAILGRASTPEELDYLASDAAFKG